MGGVSWAHPHPPEGVFHRSRLRYAPAATPQRQAAVKLHGVFSPHRGYLDCAPGCGFTGSRAGTVGTSLIHSCTPELSGGARGLIEERAFIPKRFSGELFKRVRGRALPYPARHLATLRESELLPAFSGASPGCTRGSRTASGQDSAPVHTLTGSRGPMFLLNSRVPLVTATCGPRG